MKLLFVNGSYRKKGVTSGVFAEISRILETYADIELNVVHLSDYDMKFCVGCTTCYQKGVCPLDKFDGFGEIRDKIKKADGVIFGSPNYVSNVSGLFKNFVDRMDFVIAQVMYEKYAVVVSTYQNVRGKKISSYITEQCRLSGGIVRGNILIKKDPYIGDGFTSAQQASITKEAEKFYLSIKQRQKKNLLEKVYGYVIQREFKKTMKASISSGTSGYYAGHVKIWQNKGIV